MIRSFRARMWLFVARVGALLGVVCLGVSLFAGADWTTALKDVGLAGVLVWVCAAWVGR